MTHEQTIRTGAVLGLWAVVAYFLAISVSLPPLLNRFNSFSIGLLLIGALLGLYTQLRAHRETFSLRLGFIFGIIGGTLLTVMLVTQHAARAFFRADEAMAATEEVYRGLTFVHLGMDVAWDIFITVGLMLFCWNMIRHPRFGWLLGGIGLVLESIALAFNLYTFPDNPELHGLIDVGPYAAVWLLAIFVQMFRSGSSGPARTGA